MLNKLSDTDYFGVGHGCWSDIV